MNETTIETLSTVGVSVLCIVLGIMLVSIFFWLASLIKGTGKEPDTIAVRGVLTKSTWATVHLVGSEVFEQVKFIGFTNSDSFKTHLPYELNGMVILQDQEGRQFLVRAKSIRMIVVEPETDSRSNS